MIINDQIDYFQSGRYLKNLERRYRKDHLFRSFGFFSLGISFLCLVMILGNILIDGLPSFMKRTVTIPFTLEQQILVQKSESPLKTLSILLEKELSDAIDSDHIDPDVMSLISPYAAGDFLQQILSFELPKKETMIRLNASDDLDQYFRHPKETLLQEKQITWAQTLNSKDLITRHFNI
ncbi:MAG: DUF3333 domain-containing protein, partial [Alphaproteobacteria bacterium]|nr:DUF3333 domain-containing protein [Alphaproteobacteria bacterium]